ncbi:hypothetical protein V1508DRAFT_402936 [Lipomyces doorenjongii]|uniref:uncharacterized protein n=1 Tax=Lipomyces doorenjongii TaxID=383834 RepID=UPI0034CE5A86
MEPNKRNHITIGLILTLIGVMQLTKTTHFLLPSSSFFPTMALVLPPPLLYLLLDDFSIRPHSFHVSPNLSYCIHETLWATLFREEFLNIERIENALRCCGFNTPNDRAYPFNYTDSCADMWQHETKIVAEWCIVVFSVSLRCGVGGLLHTILLYKRQSAQIPRDPPRSSRSSFNAVAVKAIERGAHSERSGHLGNSLRPSILLIEHDSILAS